MSVLLHVVVIVLVVVVSVSDEDEPAPEPPEESVEVVLDDEDLAPPEPTQPLPEEVLDDEPAEEEEPEQHEKEDEEQLDEEEQPQEEPEQLNRIAVEQVTDGEEPDQADHISDEAHRTEQETVAETTTLDDVEPTVDPEATEQEADTDREMAMEVPDDPMEQPDIVDPTDFEDVDEHRESEQAEEDQPEDEQLPEDQQLNREQPDHAESERQWRDPEEMYVETPQADDSAALDDDRTLNRREVFDQPPPGADDILEDADGDASEEGGAPSGRRLLANWEENEEAMRASLENFVPHVQPGHHTSVNAQAAEHASYIARMHRTIHANWGNGFLVRLSNNFPRSHPLNDMSLKTVVEIVIDADDGEVVETVRAEPSGNEMFDAEALNVARNVGDQPDPPASIISADGKVYIHWTFWRDGRQCGTFGVEIYQLNEDQIRDG